MNPHSVQWGESHTSLGGMGDSFYEYLLKEFLRSGARDVAARQRYDEAMQAMEKWMFKRSSGGLLYVGDYKYGRVDLRMDHLACFAGEYWRGRVIIRV